MIAAASWALATALAPGESGGSPFDMFEGWNAGQLVVLAALLPVAILVFWFGSKQFSRQRGGASLRPRGRPFFGEGTRAENDATWRQTIARLEQAPPVSIAKAAAGPVRVEATIRAASGNLGGKPGRECVWRNRAGARPDSAVGADVIVVADASGRCGVENLEQARVIAPADSHGHHWENVSLYLGDRVEIVGYFAPERLPETKAETEPEAEPEANEHGADPAELVYGTIGTEGRLQVRLVSRPDPAPNDAADPSDDENEPSSAPQPEPEPSADPDEPRDP